MVLLAGCGESARQKAAKLHQKEALHAAAIAARARKEAAAEYTTCKSQLGPLIHALADLEGHLQVGMNHSEYTQRVGDVKVAYNEIPFKSLKLRCLRAGTQAEKALNDYLAASTYWSGCIESLACADSTEKRVLQAKWAGAGTDLVSAEARMAAVKMPVAR
jgi:hypothetical protein